MKAIVTSIALLLWARYVWLGMTRRGGFTSYNELGVVSILFSIWATVL